MNVNLTEGQHDILQNELDDALNDTARITFDGNASKLVSKTPPHSSRPNASSTPLKSSSNVKEKVKTYVFYL